MHRQAPEKETEAGGQTAQRARAGTNRELGKPQPFRYLLGSIPGGDTSLLASLLKLPLPAPPSAQQIIESAWRPAKTKVGPTHRSD